MATVAPVRSAQGDPFAGHPLRKYAPTPAQRPPVDLVDQFGKVIPVTTDPAWQPPSDPVVGVKSRAGIIRREIPNGATQTGWDVAGVRGAINQLTMGLFQGPAMLVDSVVADSRIKACLSSLYGALFGRPVEFRVPKRLKDSSAAKECHEAWCEKWPLMAPESAMTEMETWAEMLGFCPGQQIWDTTGDIMFPRLIPFHPRYVYYHWAFRCYVAQTMDGQVPITPGDGNWVMHAPHGMHRGWMRGSVWPVAPWWLARAYALRDWARYSERHGMPIILALTPAAGDPAEMDQFGLAVGSLGQESAVQLPQGVDKQYSYDLKYLEASDQGWQSFKEFIATCSTEETLAIMSQNLTTEIKEGSMAAARVHGDVRQTKVEAKARGWEHTINQQMARPFAEMNFGDPDLAVEAVWNVTPPEDLKMMGEIAQALGNAMNQMRLAGVKLKDPRKFAKQFGVDLGEIEHVEPVQVAAKVAQEGGKVDPENGDDDKKEDDK